MSNMCIAFCIDYSVYENNQRKIGLERGRYLITLKYISFYVSFGIKNKIKIN